MSLQPRLGFRILRIRFRPRVVGDGADFTSQHRQTVSVLKKTSEIFVPFVHLARTERELGVCDPDPPSMVIFCAGHGPTRISGRFWSRTKAQRHKERRHRIHCIEKSTRSDAASAQISPLCLRAFVRDRFQHADRSAIDRESIKEPPAPVHTADLTWPKAGSDESSGVRMEACCRAARSLDAIVVGLVPGWSLLMAVSAVESGRNALPNAGR